MIEVGNHRVCQSEVVRREDELIGPAVKLLQHSVSTDGRLCGTQRADADSTHVVALCLGIVGNAAGLSIDNHLLRTHLVLGEILDLDGVETAQAAMYGEIGEVDAVDFQALHQLTAEMQA